MGRSLTSDLHSLLRWILFFLESGDAGISMAQGNVYGASEHNLFIQYNKTTCTFQVYTRFNCLFKRIPAFGLLFSLFSLFCIFTVSSSHGFFLRYPFVILLLFILILQWHRRCRRHCRGRRGDRALFFACNYPSLLFQIMIIKTYSNCFRREARTFHLKNCILLHISHDSGCVFAFGPRFHFHCVKWEKKYFWLEVEGKFRNLQNQLPVFFSQLKGNI